MKAILILDMPYSTCRQCILFQSITIFHSVIYWCGGKSLIIDDPNKIQDFCPLKHLPSKMDANDWHRAFSGSYEVREAKGLGYNACLDEILGEGNETN